MMGGGPPGLAQPVPTPPARSTRNGEALLPPSWPLKTLTGVLRLLRTGFILFKRPYGSLVSLSYDAPGRAGAGLI